MIDFIYTKIPFTGDINENETVLKFTFNLYQTCKYSSNNITFRTTKSTAIYACHYPHMLESFNWWEMWLSRRELQEGSRKVHQKYHNELSSTTVARTWN